MTSKWHIVDPPKYASMQEWDCQVCGRETLKHPVFLSDGSGRICAGTGCAAELLGYSQMNKKNIERERDRRANEVVSRTTNNEARIVRYKTASSEWDDFKSTPASTLSTEQKEARMEKLHSSDFWKMYREPFYAKKFQDDPQGFADYLRSQVTELESADL